MPMANPPCDMDAFQASNACTEIEKVYGLAVLIRTVTSMPAPSIGTRTAFASKMLSSTSNVEDAGPMAAMAPPALYAVFSLIEKTRAFVSARCIDAA